MADKVIDVEIRTNTTGIKSLRQELRETTIALQQATDPKLIERLQQKAGELKDTMMDVNATIEATAGSATENLAKGLGKATSVGISGFQGLISAQALFGNESKQVTETLVKLQALAGLSDALNSLGALGDTMTEIKASFIAAATKLGLFTTAKEVDIVVTEGQILATEGATVATTVLGTAMKALPIFAIIAGIGAVVAAIVIFSGKSEEAEKAEKKRAATAKAANEEQKKTIEYVSKESSGFVGLIYQIKASNEGSKERAKLIKETNDKYGTTLKNLSDENEFQSQLNRSVQDYITIKSNESKLITNQKFFDQQLAKRLVAEKELNRIKADGQRQVESGMRKSFADYLYENELARDANKIAQKNFDDASTALTGLATRRSELSSQQDKLTEGGKKYVEQTKDGNDKVVKSTKLTAEELAKIQAEANEKYIEAQDARFKLENELTLTAAELKAVAIQQQLEKDIAIAGDDEGLIKLAVKKAQDDITKITIDAEIARQEAEVKLRAEAVAKEDAEFLRLQELTVSKLDYDKLVLAQKYEAEYLAAKGNADLQIALKKKLDADLLALDTESATKKKATEQEVQNAKLQMASDAFGALGSLIDATAGKDEKSQKKAFNVNKAASIGQAIISTYLAANSALASPANNLFPGQAQIAAGVAIVGGLANVAKISRTQFGSGGGGGGGTPPSAPAPSSTQQPSATPSFNLYGSGGTANNQNASGNSTSSQNITVTAVVSETDMTYNQGRVNAMKLSAAL